MRKPRSADQFSSRAVEPGARRTRTPGRRRRVALVAAAVVGALVVAAALTFQYGLPWWTAPGDRNHVHRSELGSMRYQVHVPPQQQGITQGERSRLPVIMALHGCGMTGYGYNSMKATTQFNQLADREGFLVVYPTQRVLRSVINCWNSGDPREQHRNAGEPALLAAVAREVIAAYGADPDRVHVTGASSGAGAAVILAATYPDVFASASSVAGGEYGLNQVDPDDPGATPPSYTARQAWSQMGDRARVLPMLIMQGEQDVVVAPLVGRRLAEHWSVVADLADDRAENDSAIATTTRSRVPGTAGRHPYRRAVSSGRDGRSVVESYLVAGLGHAWPGPTGDGWFTDRAGPDASEIIWDFVQRHPRR